ncbi:hypothetical protein BK120_22445 [Paenibacillus sp. FSL A5-0031]|uniref:DUF2634 domain-containing protein n=1 Tax=unclassified Paenibacillus TaxID=185978 RepID=UPI00096C45C2|nr:DUF2634 domain-containing protein [Paenibacillus sp. FSL A5-0031]OME79063.1 hypothetical protein BK120_22445 [Paenibacillus sp. FSL A5-0031]
MIPQGANVAEVTTVEELETSETYKLDLASKRIIGRTDGLEAVKQAVFKILQTERYRYFCYSTNYGTELESLLGGSPSYVQSELKRSIQEALMQDERVSDVIDFQYEMKDEAIVVQFTVVTEFGSFGEEVSQNV